MQPEMSSSAIAIVGVGFFFAAIALLFIIAYRHAQHAAAVVSSVSSAATSEQDQQPEGKIRPVFVPLPAVVEGGAPLPASVMLVAPRADRPTVRELVTPPASPASTSDMPAIPDETAEAEQDIAQQPTQKTQAIPVQPLQPRFKIIFNPRGERLVMLRPDPHESLPHFWQN